MAALRVTLPTRVIEISFSHSNPKVEETGRFTLCEICVISAMGASIAGTVAIARCHPWYDQFSKATGRKLALTRALKNFGLSKDERRVVWEKYWEICGVK
jgi:hypothetical protein